MVDMFSTWLERSRQKCPVRIDAGGVASGGLLTCGGVYEYNMGSCRALPSPP